MNYYLTPTKQTPAKNPKSTNHKSQDWVCFVCNNLNFSFRKKCNRCKTQTRSKNENQVAKAYSHYYYEHDGSRELKSPLSETTNLYTPQPRTQTFVAKELDMNIDKLARHYQPKQAMTTLSEEMRGSRSSFATQFWQNIDVHDFQETAYQQEEDHQLKRESEMIEADLERMFSKILLEEE